MKKIINYIIVGILISFAYNCEEDLPSGSINYVTFAVPSLNVTVDVGAGSDNVDIKVYTANTTGSDRTFDLMVDAETSTADASAYSVPSSVTIPGGTNEGMFSVQLNESGLDFASSSVVVAIVPNGAFTTSDSGSITINAALVCPTQNQVEIAITTDNWPDETSWDITDSTGAIVASGGPFVNPDDDFTTITIGGLCLLAGTYTATVYDSYGDGGGSFEVTSNGVTLAVGSAPDAGGGYPVVTSGSGTFTMN